MRNRHTLHLHWVLWAAIISVAYCENPEGAEPMIDHFHYGTKTAYNLAYPQMSVFIKDALGFQDHDAPPEQCSLVQMNLVFRHGTRRPSHGDVSKIDKLVRKLNEYDLKNPKLKSYTNTHTMEVEKMLTSSGHEENRAIAQRLFARYTGLLSKSLVDLDLFNIYSSKTQRSEASAAAFIDGLIDASGEKWETSFHKKLDSRVTIRQDLLRFFDECRRYNNNMDDPHHWLHEEFDSFKNSAPMVAAADRISKRLFKSNSGAGESASITPGEMKVLWALCGCELAINGINTPSPWCDLFTKEDRMVLEYYWDLKSYWKKAYGESLNHRQSCPLLSHLYENMNDARSNARSALVNVYFGHAETLLPLQALLGLFKDADELNVENYERLAESRLFRSSFMVPFAGNLGVHLFKCQPVEQNTNLLWPQQLEKYMVQIQLNEHVIPFPFTNQSAISLTRFEQQYLDEIKSCDFNSLCKNVQPTQLSQGATTPDDKNSFNKKTAPSKDGNTGLKKELKKPVEEEAYPPQVPEIDLNQLQHDEL